MSVCPVGRLDWRRDPRLVKIDASAPVGHVSAGSTSLGSTKLQVLPFLNCRSRPLESFGGDALLNGGEDLPAPNWPGFFEKDIAVLMTRLFLVLL